MNSTDVLFCGCFYPEKDYEDIKSNSIGGLQNAADVFQKRMISGLETALGGPIATMTKISVGGYPNGYKQLWVHSQRYSRNGRSDDYSLGFFNLTMVKHFIPTRQDRKFVRQWIEKDPGNRKYIILYSYDIFFFPMMRYIKKRYPQVEFCITVNDLPQYTLMNRKGKGFLGNLYRRYKQSVLDKNKHFIDKYLVITQKIAEFLEIPPERYVVVEALINTEGEPPSPQDSTAATEPETSITYGGGLSELYGVKDLVDSFMRIGAPDYRLNLCGSGDLTEYIVQCAEKDHRITYWGVLSPEEAMSLYKKSTILVNPRKNSGEFTKYSFPIKTIDFLYSGTPMIGYKLAGIGDDYDAHIYYADENDPDGLYKKLLEIGGMDKRELRRQGLENREFIIREKSSHMQMKKLINLLEKADGGL